MKQLYFNLLFFIIIVPVKIFEFMYHYPNDFVDFFKNPILSVQYNIDDIVMFNTMSEFTGSIILLLIISIWRFKYIGMSGWYSLATLIPLWNIYLIIRLINNDKGKIMEIEHGSKGSTIKETKGEKKENKTVTKSLVTKSSSRKSEIDDYETKYQNKSTDIFELFQNKDHFLIVTIVVVLVVTLPALLLYVQHSFKNYESDNHNQYLTPENMSNLLNSYSSLCGKNSSNDENGNCSCNEGYEWEFPNDDSNYDCKLIISGDPNSDNIWIENTHGLMWQKKPEYVESWYDAENKANNSSLAGYTDWRLPTNVEIKRLYICNNFKCTPRKEIESPFNGYWTGSDRDINFYGDAGKMYLKADEGIFPGIYLNSPGAVRLVRDL